MNATDELKAVAIETACEAVRAREAVLLLRDAAGSLSEKEPDNGDAIRQVARAYRIPVRHRQLKHIVLNLTDVLIDDISNANLPVSKTIEVFAPERDLQSWRRGGILPMCAYHEAARSALVAQESAHDPAAIALQLERCKLAREYPASLVLHIAQAALSGDTSPTLGAYLR